MTSDLLRQCDIVLSRCGRPIGPPGTRVVAIPKAFKCWAVFPAASPTLLSTVQTTISGDTTWMMRAISSYSTVPVGLSLQIQFPDGRFLFHDLSDIRAITGYGSWRFPLTNERACPPGSKIIATFSDTAPAAAQNVPLLLEGAYYFHMRGHGGRVHASALAASLPRFVPLANQNIMAPCWALGEGPSTPVHAVDSPEYVWASNVFNIDVGAATAKTAIALLQIEQGSDAAIRNLWFKVVPVAGVQAAPLGNLLVKVRSSSGYALTDDYVLASYINGVPLPKDWLLRAGETIICDLQLVDFAGQGSFDIQCFAKGVKRRAA